MRKLLLPLLCVITLVCAATMVNTASAVNLNVRSTQLYTQKSQACARQNITVTANVANGVTASGFPASCMGAALIVRLSGGLIGLAGITAKGTVTGSSVTIPSPVLSSLISTVGSSLGNVKSEVLTDGWSMPSTWGGVTN